MAQSGMHWLFWWGLPTSSGPLTPIDSSMFPFCYFVAWPPGGGGILTPLERYNIVHRGDESSSEKRGPAKRHKRSNLVPVLLRAPTPCSPIGKRYKRSNLVLVLLRAPTPFPLGIVTLLSPWPCYSALAGIRDLFFPSVHLFNYYNLRSASKKIPP